MSKRGAGGGGGWVKTGGGGGGGINRSGGGRGYEDFLKWGEELFLGHSLIVIK